jgi:hypothetical protein
MKAEDHFSEDEFRRRLDRLDMHLDRKAFAAALAGARHLKSEVAKVAAYLANRND